MHLPAIAIGRTAAVALCNPPLKSRRDERPPMVDMCPPRRPVRGQLQTVRHARQGPLATAASGVGKSSVKLGDDLDETFAQAATH